MAGSFENGNGSSGCMGKGNFLVILVTTGLSSRSLPHEVYITGLNLVMCSSVTSYRAEFECVNELPKFETEPPSAQGASVYKVLQNRLLASNTLTQCTLIYVVESLSSWNVVLSHHITRYSHTLTQIHIGPRNSYRWPLCKSANVDITVENIAETYWQ
jgi:hypothetical protein